MDSTSNEPYLLNNNEFGLPNTVFTGDLAGEKCIVYCHHLEGCLYCVCVFMLCARASI